jgi:hypothetical protein
MVVFHRNNYRQGSQSPPPSTYLERKMSEDISQFRLRAVAVTPYASKKPAPERQTSVERFGPQLRPVARPTPQPTVQRIESPPLRPVERQSPEPTVHRFQSPPLRPVERQSPQPIVQRIQSPPPLKPVEHSTPKRPEPAPASEELPKVL